MPLVVVTNFPATAKPTLADVRATEGSFLDALGGVLEGVTKPGALDAANIAAAAGFTRFQVAEPRHRAVLHQAPTSHAIKPIVIVPWDTEIDTLLFWHSAAEGGPPVAGISLKGKLGVFVNGVEAAEVPAPEGGVERGALAECAVSLALGAGDIVQVKGINAAEWLTKSDGTQPPIHTQVFVTLLGAAVHVA